MTIGESEHHQEGTRAYCYKKLRPQLTIAYIKIEGLSLANLSSLV
jgi:hypothetical protein